MNEFALASIDRLKCLDIALIEQPNRFVSG